MGPPPPPPGGVGYSYETGSGPGNKSSVSTALIIIAGIAFALSLLLALGAGNTSTNNVAGTIGYVLAGIVVCGGISLLVWKFASPKAGAITLLVLSLLSSCSSLGVIGNEVSEDQEIIEAVEFAIEESGVERTGPQTFVATRSEERCFEDQGVTPEDILLAFTDTSVEGGDTQIRILDATLVCAPRVIDDPTFIEDFRMSFSAGLGTEVTVPEVQCLLNFIIDNSPSPGRVLAGEDVPLLIESSELCLSQDVLDTVFGVPGTGPQVYGDDATFDLLYDRCTDGSEPACDLLYSRSSIGSDYEAHAETCAGRVAGSDFFCVAGIEDNNRDGFADDDSPGFPPVALACEAGDMIACDFLTTVSPLGSEVYRVGETCGNRLVVAAVPCLTRFGERADE